MAGLLKPSDKTKFAVLRPTPLNLINSSISSGTTPLSSSSIIFENSTICFDLF